MTDDPILRRRRPVLVTIIVILTYITGVASVLIGVVTLLGRYDVPRDEVLSVSLLGSGIILLGLLTIGIASGLARGSRLSRTTVTAYLAVQLVLHVVTIVTTDGWDWAAAVQIVIEAAIVVALWAPPASHFFVSSSVRAAERRD